MTIIDIALNLDHGKGNSRLAMNIIARWTQTLEDGQHNKKHESIAVAVYNTKCCKDNEDIIKHMFGNWRGVVTKFMLTSTLAL
jgi:hypothetical protein